MAAAKLSEKYIEYLKNPIIRYGLQIIFVDEL